MILLRRSLFGVLSKIKIISPKSKFTVIWDFLILLTIVWNFLIITTGIFFGEPYNNTYLFTNDQYAKNQYVILLWFFFIIQTADVFIKFVTGYFENGELIIDSEKIVKRYFRNLFIFHLVNSILLLLQMMTEYSEREQDSLKLFQLIYIINIKRLDALVRSLEEYFFFEDINDAFFALIKLFLKMFAISHCMACVWHGVGQLSKCSSDTWLEQYDLLNKDWQSRYVYSLYWAIMTLTTIGYGDITPRNNSETLLASFCMCLGSGLFGYLMSTIGTIMGKINEKETQFKKDMLMMSRILKKKEIDNNLQYRVKQYLEYILKEENKVNNDKESELIGKLSLSLREELIQESYGRIIEKFPILSNNFSEKFLKSLVHVMKPVRYSPEELVFEEFTSSERNLYLISKGQLEVSLFTCKTGKPFTQIKTLNKWESIGELSFFTDKDVSATAKSIGFSLIYIIRRNDFLEVLKDYPQDYETFCQLRDHYLFYKDFTRLYMKCYSCGSPNHSLFLCPALYYNARIDKKTKQQLNSEGLQTFRMSHERRLTKHQSLRNLQFYASAAEKFRTSTSVGKELSKNSLSPNLAVLEEESFQSFENLDVLTKPKKKSELPEIYLLTDGTSLNESGRRKLFPLNENLKSTNEKSLLEPIYKGPKLMKASTESPSALSRKQIPLNEIASLKNIPTDEVYILAPAKKREDGRKHSYLKALAGSFRSLPPNKLQKGSDDQVSKSIILESPETSARQPDKAGPQENAAQSKGFSPPYSGKRSPKYMSDEDELSLRTSFLNYGDNMFLRGFDAMKNWNVYFPHNNPDLIIMKMQNSNDAEQSFELKSLKKKLYDQRRSILITAMSPTKMPKGKFK